MRIFRVKTAPKSSIWRTEAVMLVQSMYSVFVTSTIPVLTDLKLLTKFCHEPVEIKLLSCDLANSLLSLGLLDKSRS